MKSTDRVLNVLAWCYRLVNHVLPWHRLPKILGIGNLVALRHDLRRWNLFDTAPLVAGTGKRPCPFHSKDLEERRADGSHNDLQAPSMGSAGCPFGRNAPFDVISAPPEPGLETPSPRAISRLLMTRTQFIPATSLNLLAAAWIQFQVHDWFGHQQEDEATAPIELAEGDTWREHPMMVRRTKQASGAARGCPAKVPIFLNTETHWWDGSQLYGSGATRQQQVRSGRRGTLTIDQGRLPSMESVDRELPGIDLTGFNDNY